MKGILKIYHPEETLKYNIRSTYCKAVYIKEQHFLEVEIITDDSLDHVDDDSLQYNFPQISLGVYDYPISSSEIEGKPIHIKEDGEDTFTQVDLFDDDEAFLYDNELVFGHNEEGERNLVWSGTIDDFYTGSDEPIAFKLKCHFKDDEINIAEE